MNTMHRMGQWKTGVFLLWCGLSACGCGGTANPEVEKVSPEEQFREIADEKEKQLKTLLEAKGSELSGYKAEMTDETDIQKKADYPHIGTINFSYAITKPEGENKWRVMTDLNVKYRFSSKSHKWKMVTHSSKYGNSFLSKGDARRIVEQSEVLKLFQN